MAKVPPAGLALKVERDVEGVSQEELARIAGVTRLDIVRAEQGKSRLSIGFLGRLLRFPETVTEGLRLMFEWLSPGPPDASLPPLGLTLKERRAIAGEALREAAFRAHQLANIRLQEHIRAARLQAREVWVEIQAWEPEPRQTFLEKASHLSTWALVELLCDESERAAPGDDRRCRELAELACRVALWIDGTQAWRDRVAGYAWAFFANAFRVAGDLPGAEPAFARAWVLWHAGARAGAGPLDASRLYDLEASLRRDLRQWPAALDRLDRALAHCQPGREARLLLKRAFTLKEKGDAAEAIQVLSQAESLVHKEAEPRLLNVLRFNRAACLADLGRLHEAEEMMGDLRNGLLRLGDTLDLIRFAWLEGRVAAGLGRLKEAEDRLREVRQEFSGRGMVFDEVLVVLDLARVYLTRGWTVETRELAAEVEPVFRALGVETEARRAVEVFWQAALVETATVELVERTIQAFRQAQPVRLP